MEKTYQKIILIHLISQFLNLFGCSSGSQTEGHRPQDNFLEMQSVES
jgi:hypothetical protein